MTKPKIIFMGTPAFSATVLQGVIDSDQYEILGLVTQPDRKVGRKREIIPSPAKRVALNYGLKVFQPEKLSSSPDLEVLMNLGADGIVTAAFGQFLPGKLLDAVEFAVNVHASLLPKYRGGAPIHYALLNGESETGVTLMEMVRQMDAGDMIAQRSIDIEISDNVGTLFEKLAILGRDLLLETLPDYLTGNIQPQAQDESQVSFSPNITPEEEEIDWTKPAEQIFNQIRGMNPYPVAYTYWEGKRFKIYEGRVVRPFSDSEDGSPRHSVLPGQVIERTKKSLILACGQGQLELILVQPAGKGILSISDFLNGLGREMKEGDILGK